MYKISNQQINSSSTRHPELVSGSKEYRNSFRLPTRHAELDSASYGYRSLHANLQTPKTLKQVQDDGSVVQDDELRTQGDEVRVGLRAFTLAEVMIVLAIIGILVAILLPTAQNLTPDEALMKFQKNNVNLGNAIRNLANSEEYYYNGDFGLDRNNEKITDPKYFCSALADMLGAKRINCSEDNLGYNTSALANLPDMLTYEMEDGSMIYDYVDCMCKNNLTSGEEIKLNDNTIIYTINPYYHFGSLIDGSDKRLFNLCSNEKRYKFICMDIDGLNNGEDPFGYAIRADGRIIYGSRAQAWIDRKINDNEELPTISSIDSCEPTALSITPEEDTCVAPPTYVPTPVPTPTPSVPEATELLFTYTGSYSETTSTSGGQKILLKTSGTFTALSTIKGTLFLVGGGGGGGKLSNSDTTGGGGGGGGLTNETLFTFQKDTPYEVSIGSGGGSQAAGGTTKFGESLTASGGGGAYKATGGSGTGKGGNGGVGKGGTSGGAGIEFDGSWYGGGGGGGGSGYSAPGGKGGGGSGAGGTGGAKGTTNTGGGGGGAHVNGPFAGGSGIIVIVVEKSGS